jgi:hypothetical protein
MQPTETDTKIAAALLSAHNENDGNIELESLFWMQTPGVNTAGLLQLAEWRNANTIEMFLKNGADVNCTDEDAEGLSVLELVLSGHDGYWRDSHWNPDVFDVLTKYKVKKEVRQWIIDECCARAPKYVFDFLKN